MKRKTNTIEQHLLENNDRMVEYISNIKDAIRSINDANLLHNQILDKNTSILEQAVKNNAQSWSLIGKVLFAVTAALILIAGAEKALRFL